MRNAFINTLMLLAEKEERIYLLTGDAGFTILERFIEKFPGRYLNVGIAEANLIGVAAGLALSGKIVFCYSIIPFVTMRCFEQVRVDLCYQKLPVKLVGVGEGVTYGTAGATHHAIEDIAIMRALPNMTVICPGDPFEMENAVAASLALSGPCYIRLGKSGEAKIHASREIGFTLGRGIKVREGQGAVLISTGNMLPAAAEICRKLAERGFQPGLVSMHTVKPIDRDLIQALPARYRLVATLEEHNVIGGLSSAVGDVILEEQLPLRLIKFAIPDRYACVAGSQEYLRKDFGLATDDILARLEQEMRRSGITDK
jgi:transketolase